MVKNLFKWLYRILIGVGVLLLLIRLADWAARHGQPLPAVPQPNGYPALLSAARSLPPPPDDVAELTPAQIVELATRNRPVLEQARHALEMDSGVTLAANKRWDDQHEEDLACFKKLVVDFGLESKVQLLDNHTNEAERCYLDIIRLAQAVSKGGLLLDGITSLGMEAIGSSALQMGVPKMDAAFSRAAAQALEALDARREKPESVIQTEQAWSAQRFGLVHQIGDWITGKDLAKNHAKFINRAYETRQRTQKLMVRLAAHAYELEHHQPPAKLADLVPEYLKGIPHDAKTGQEIQEIPAVLN